MENMLRWGFFLIGAFIIFLIIYDVWFRRGNRLSLKQEISLGNTVDEPFIESNTNVDSWNTKDDVLPQMKFAHHVPPISVAAEDDIIIISVLAKPPEQFASYDLLQSISATGMQYGAMDIFHFYQPTDQGYITLFSLASATKPGKFDLDHMGDFSCIGLSLFMNKTSVPNSKQAFLIMLEKAQQLADDLNGELRAGPERIPLDDETVQHYLNHM
jgi:FtsZ-interacting cell division protein ZipA